MEPVGMEAIVTALSTAFAPATILGQIAALMPAIGVLIPTVLAIYFLRRFIKGAGKAKLKFQLKKLGESHRSLTQGWGYYLNLESDCV